MRIRFRVKKTFSMYAKAGSVIAFPAFARNRMVDDAGFGRGFASAMGNVKYRLHRRYGNALVPYRQAGLL